MATVRVVTTYGTSTAQTSIYADSQQSARLMLICMYGRGNVLSVQQITHDDVTETTKTLSPQELQVKSLADKAENYKQQEKALKARQQMAKAQQNLMKATSGFSASKKR